jgi:hypothetical protein
MIITFAHYCFIELKEYLKTSKTIVNDKKRKKTWQKYLLLMKKKK